MLASASAAQQPTQTVSRREALLQRLEKTSRRYLNAPRNDGKFLRILVRAREAKRALEVGSSNGYSAIWIGSALESTGGHLWSIEIDADKAKECIENLKAAGLESTVTGIHGDAFKEIPKLEGSFDYVFIDIGAKNDEALKLILPRVSDGGVILAHDSTLLATQLKPYIEFAEQHPRLETVTLTTPGGFGFVLSVVRESNEQ